MGIETAEYIEDLDPQNPKPNDPISQGDDHIKMIKKTLQKTFPGADSAQYVPATPKSDGSTAMGDGGRWVENASVTTDSSGTLNAANVAVTETVGANTVTTQNFTTTDAQVDGTLMSPTIITANLTAGQKVKADQLEATTSLTAGSIDSDTISCGTLSATGNITSAGAITGTHIGDGSQLSGLPSGYDDWSINGTNVGSGDAVNIVGGSNVTISSSGRNITINSTASSNDTSTNITAGNGISVGGGSGNYSIAMSGSYTGNFTATGNVTAYSDDRLKVRDGEVVNALGKVKEIDTFYYTPSAAGESIGMPQERNAGVSAQQVQEIFPEAVIESEGYLAVDYGRLVILCLEAIKQLSEDRD
jgi:hypothetical protein